MPLFAIAYVYDDFPRYDRVEHVGNRLKYFDKGVLVNDEPAPHWHVVKSPHLGIDFIEAGTSQEAYHLFLEKFSQHIITTTITPVPSTP